MFKKLIIILPFLLLSGCARDLSSNVYTSDATQNLTLEGKIIGVRKITIKNSDQLSGNSTGILSGGLMGGAIGSTVGGGSGRGPALMGGVLIGAAVGSALESGLGTVEGYEYIVKLNKAGIKDGIYYEGSAPMRAAMSAAASTGMIAVVQGLDGLLHKNQKVYVIVSDKRTRIIPAE